MPLILPGNVASATASTAYSIANSCRFDVASEDTLKRTFGTATEVDKWTFSTWIKVGPRNATNQQIFGPHEATAGLGSFINFQQSVGGDEGTLRVHGHGGSISSNLYNVITDAHYRDVAAWFHLVLAWDTTQGTAANRLKLYVNGAQVTSFSTETYPAQDTTTSYTWNTAIIHTLCCQEYTNTGLSQFMPGYLAEVVFIDGLALAPTSFGEFDEDSPTIWKPKDPSGLTFGNNGFWLDFEDSSALGNDVSGNDNDWTVGNLDATNQATDSPTNNFCVMNSLDNYFPASTLS